MAPSSRIRHFNCHTDSINLIFTHTIEVAIMLPVHFEFGPEAGRRCVVRFSLVVYRLRESTEEDPASGERSDTPRLASSRTLTTQRRASWRPKFKMPLSYRRDFRSNVNTASYASDAEPKPGSTPDARLPGRLRALRKSLGTQKAPQPIEIGEALFSCNQLICQPSRRHQLAFAFRYRKSNKHFRKPHQPSLVPCDGRSPSQYQLG